MRNKILTAGSYRAAGLPNIEGAFAINKSAAYSDKSSYNQIDTEGAFACNGASKLAHGGQSSWTDGGSSKFTFNASKSHAIYGSSETVQPSAIMIQYFIKY